jgi:tetratricopeptide (TPR) repeat protein
VIRRSPQRQAAQLLAVQVAEARMMLADNARLDGSALGHAQRAVSRLDALMAATTLTEAERLHASQVLMNVSLFYKNADRFAESVASGRRAMAMMPETSRSPGLRAQGLSIIADAMRLSGDLDGALRTIQEARRSLDVGSFDDASALQLRFSVLWREGIILGEDGRVSLGRTEEAIAVLQQAFDLIEDWSSRDVANAGSRVLFISAGRELGTLLWRTDPARALAVFDRAQQRLAEIKDNPRARRGMIDLLAGSSYALRALGRPQEAGQRLDAAAARLDELSANAASPGLLDAEKEVVMRARAEHFADTGQPRQAIELYQLLLNDVGGTAAPDASLTDACRFSQIYEALGRLHRAIDDEAAAAGFDRQRRDLWAGWSGRLSGNVFVVRQLALAEQGRRARYAS